MVLILIVVNRDFADGEGAKSERDEICFVMNCCFDNPIRNEQNLK
jgi:hypothetical protein